METVFEKMNEAIDSADREASQSNRAAVKDVPTKVCSRCGGKGSDFFMGGSRAPGICFKCGGSGKVLVPGKAKKAAKLRQAEIELIRLRACWKAIRSAVTELEAAPSPSWAGRHTLSDLKRRLASYEKAGKEKAAEVAS